MKTIINYLKYTCILAIFMIMSCQNEINETITSNQDETLTANSTAAVLLKNLSANDGSSDNIIDGASCFSIALPVTVIVNGTEVVVASEEDFEIIEALFEEFDNDDDTLVINYPITIVLSDFSEIVIENEAQLEEFRALCVGENLDDDDIECVDIQYPITASLFDADNNLLETITIDSDEALFTLLDSLDSNVFLSINFPITLELADGSSIVVNNLTELVSILQSAGDDCDEDDDNDFDDDDNNQITPEDFQNLLTQCTWEIDKFNRDNNSDDDRFEDYIFTFGLDGSLNANFNNELFTGNYTINEDGNGLRIDIVMDNLTAINNNWRLHGLDDEGTDEQQVDLRLGKDRLRFEQDCEGNDDGSDDEGSLTAQEVNETLMECFWRGVPNSNDGFTQYEFNFNENDELLIENSENDEVITGTWMTTSTDDTITVTIDANDPLNDFDGAWAITNFEDERIEFVDAANTLLLEKECE